VKIKSVKRTLIVWALLGALLAIVPLAQAQGEGYDLSWSTVDSGGATSLVAGDYQLSGSVGQADAAPSLGSGSYKLSGGFWRAREALLSLYLPVVLRDN
jgi:hypothetical protein